MGPLTALIELQQPSESEGPPPARRTRRRLPRPTTLHWWAISVGTAWVVLVVALAYAVRF